MTSHQVLHETVDGFEGVVLVSPELRAGFCPGVGMVGYTLEHEGEELLGQRGGLPAYAERGSSFGLPLLHPWANRLSGFDYEVAGHKVNLDPDRTPVRPDEHGRPIHGLLAASRYWEVAEAAADGSAARLTARLDFAAHAELMAGFPFLHELRVQVALTGATLTVTTTLEPTGDDPVPIAFGWHPYLTLPGVPREDWRVELPVRSRAELDDGGIPTGKSEAARGLSGPLADRVFDDLFPELNPPARFLLEGGGRRIELEQDPSYPVAQVYAPEGSDFICWEPMTAPTNALVSGDTLRVVEPGETYAAGFQIKTEVANE